MAKSMTRELGSLGAVVMDRMDHALKGGIERDAHKRVERAAEVTGRDTVKQELEAQRTRTSCARRSTTPARR